jgi:RNA polymerase sigma-70 factor (ECF subfamily)
MDSDLVVRAQRGDQAAFTTLASQHYDRLHQIAYRVLRDRSMAEDAAQQAIVAIWRNLPQLREPGRFDAWSYRLLVNACNDEARKMKRRLPPVGGSPMTEPAAADGYGPIIERDRLERAFERLSIDHRAVIVLHHYLDMTVEAVAETLDVPVGTVNSRLHRALEKMRLALEADQPEPLDADGEASP